MKCEVNRICFLLFFWSVILNAHAPFAWEKTDYVWNFGLRYDCDVGVNTEPEEYFSTLEFPYKRENYLSIKENDLVWIRPSFLKHFYEDFIEGLDKKIVLVICDGDESFPKDCGLTPTELENLLSSPFIQHVFTQNYDYRGPSKKVSPIPIGIDFHSIAFKGGRWGEKGSPKEQQQFLQDLLATSLPTRKRKIKAFVDFQHSESMRASFQRYKDFDEDRLEIFQKILKSNVVEFSKKLDRSALWKKKCEYAFSISPWGNGLDCHRTWEDLALGCIVIVKTSSLDPLYSGLPVVIVNDWDEIDDENLEKWFHLFQDASENLSYREKITNTYWFNKILAARAV
jgi:hypothetical protein